MMNDHWFLILNPRAGSGKGERHWKKIASLLDKEGILYEKHVTTRSGHATELASQAVHRGFRKIIIVGGDGSANETANGILQQQAAPSTEVTMAQIPVGTGKDWGRTVGIPADYASAVRVIRQGKTMIQDVGRVRYKDAQGNDATRYFVNIAGMGYDAFVGEYVDSLRKKGRGGKMYYLVGLVSCLMRFEPLPSRYRVNENSRKDEVFSIAAGICRFNGGGMMQCPSADPDDGLLDVTVIHRISKGKVIRSIGKLFNGRFVHEPEVKTFRGTEFLIESEGRLPVEADGEYLGTAPARVSIEPLRLKVVVK